MKPALEYLLSILMTYLPPRYRAEAAKLRGPDLKVYSFRPKLHWNPYMTIEFEEKFYQYFKEEYGRRRGGSYTTYVIIPLAGLWL